MRLIARNGHSLQFRTRGTSECCCSYQAGVIPQAGWYHWNCLEGHHGIATDYVVNAAFHEIEALRHAATHDDAFRAEEMNQAGEARAKIRSLFPQQFETQRVALPRSFNHMTGINRFSGQHFAEQAVRVILR